MAVLARGQPRYKSITSIPGWAENLEGASDKVSTPARAYAYVPLVYRAINLRCDSLASVPRHFYRGETIVEPEALFPNLDWEDLLKRTEAALCLTGGAYWLVVRNSVRALTLQWLNPLTMEVRYKDGVTTFHQSIGAFQQDYTADEIVYFRDFNPVDDIGPGIGPAEVALNDAALKRYMSRFAAYFFEGGAMPALLLGLPPSTSEDERKRTENFFKRMLTGIERAFKVLAIKSGVIDPKVISFPLNQLAMPELSEQAMEGISSAFGIRKSILGDPANYATAKEDWDAFWKSTVRPRGQYIQSAANMQLFRRMGLRLEIAFEELDIFQEDEADRASSLKTVMDFLTACPTYAIFEALSADMGYEWSVQTLAAVQAWYTAKEAAQAEPEPPAPPVEDEQEAEPVEPPAPVRSEITPELRAELLALRAKVRHAIKNGHSPDVTVSFRRQLIPVEMYAALGQGLQVCGGMSDAMELFDDLLGYDPTIVLARATAALEAMAAA